jgi:hypothetical protein
MVGIEKANNSLDLQLQEIPRQSLGTTLDADQVRESASNSVA